TGWYEARTVAVFVDESERVTARQMQTWASQFDSWAICDTACFHLFDRTAFAWEKVHAWAEAKKEFVRRGSYALLWALSVHDKSATDAKFKDALKLIEQASPDDRPLVTKGMDMALRAVGKRSKGLNAAAIGTAKKLSKSEASSLAWVGKHALKELQSTKVQGKWSC
ncbi:MAG: DNA alkylation repair protein, partial [Candidatus Eisenbacteria bacterium]|nr:DNA alkylation repair protein [Candidatus Eisenbacteria bacterium]